MKEVRVGKQIASNEESKTLHIGYAMTVETIYVMILTQARKTVQIRYLKQAGYRIKMSKLGELDVI